MSEKNMDTQNAAFWLPCSFLNDDVLPKDDEFLFSNSVTFDSPNSFPDSSLSLELGEGDDSNCNREDELMSELTRKLGCTSLHESIPKKTWNLSTSPQSTLTGFGPWATRNGFSSNGRPNGPSSPPLTPPPAPQNDAAWELLYEAAGQVARLKINALAAEINHRINQLNHHYNHQHYGGLLGGPRNSSLYKPPQHHLHNALYDFPQYEQVKGQGNGNIYCNHHHQWGACNGGPPLGPAWPPLKPNNPHYRNPNGSVAGMRSVFHNGLGSGPVPGPGVKRQSTGTGVFLPRNVGNNGCTTTTNKLQEVSELRKKSSGCPMWLQARGVDALNMEFEEANNGVNYKNCLLSDKEVIMARRNLIMEQQRSSFMRNDEIRLPSDWTY